ncbi:Hypothetical protein CINCED_3A009495 [Cinara cedri]|nr:Hypothetical protein CINCED_3A009495 [Cinara cedri]
MAEMNEIDTQSNFDYVLNSYYLPVNQYNTGFELLDDCKNMSFSELFDQELFSSHENKDCQITIKIENENSLDPCYSADESQDITDNHILVNTNEENLFPTKSFIPKPGINRTFIKPAENSDVTNLLYNPFCDTDDFSINKISVKTATENSKLDVRNTIQQNMAPVVKQIYCPVDNSQGIGNNLHLEKSEDSVLSSSKSYTSNQGNNNISKKPSANDDIIQNSLCETVNFGIDIMNCAPENVNRFIEQNAVPLKTQSKNYTQSNSLIKEDRHSLVSVKKKVPSSSSLTLNIFPKKLKIDRTSINIIKNVKQPVQNSIGELENTGINHKSTKVRGPTVKRKPKDVINTIQQKTSNSGGKSCYSNDNLQNSTDNHNSVKSEFFKSCTSKRQSNKKISSKATEKSDIKYSYNTFDKPQVLGNDQISGKIKPHILKRKPVYANNKDQNIFEIKVKSCTDNSQNTTKNQNFEEILNTSTPKRRRNNKTFTKTTETNEIKHPSYNSLSETKVFSNDQISMKVEHCIKEEPLYINFNEQNINEIEVETFSTDNLQNTINSHNLVKIEETLKSSVPKYQDNNKSTMLTMEKNNIKQTSYNSFREPKDFDNNQISVKVEPYIKEESVDIYNNIEQYFGEIVTENHHNVDEAKHDVSSNYIYDTNLNYTNIKTQEFGVIKKENIVPITACLKNNESSSQTCVIKSEPNLETEKKKISWEEFRAKRAKIGFMNTPENDEKFSDIYDGKTEAIIKEFNRTTAEHFDGQIRKLEVKEGQNPINSKDNSSEEDEELQKKRMKIEYIKKLLPSSFASEIAKTSSLMKGSSQENIENENTLSDSNMSNDKTQGKYIHEEYLKKDDKSQKKGHQTRVHTSHRISSSRADYCNKTNRSSNSDDYYNRNRIDSPREGGPYGQNIRNNGPRLKEQKRVVYVGQIPIKFGKRYLYNRFKEFGVIQCLTLHRKPDFRVYYAFVTYSERSEAERAINHGNDDANQVQLDIRFGERKQTQTPYYDLDDEWLTDWYTYASKLAAVRSPIPGNAEHSFEEELKEFYNLAQMKKLNEIKSSSQVS